MGEELLAKSYPLNAKTKLGEELTDKELSGEELPEEELSKEEFSSEELSISPIERNSFRCFGEKKSVT